MNEADEKFFNYINTHFTDGIIRVEHDAQGWRACFSKQGEHQELHGTHRGTITEAIFDLAALKAGTDYFAGRLN